MKTETGLTATARTRRLEIGAAAVLAFMLVAASCAADGAEPVVSGPTMIGPPVTPSVFDGDLRDLPPAPEWRFGDPIRYVPRRRFPPSDLTVAPFMATERDPLIDLQRAAGRTTRAFSPPTVSVQGLGFSGVYPPDPAGDVGPNHYIQSINGSGGAIFRVFDKNGGPLTGTIQMDSLWVGGGACGTGLGDPIVLYDEFADRWLLSEFSSAQDNLCVYISQTPDPIGGGWFGYGFRPSNSFPDYPKYSVWPDGYYVTANQNVGAGRPIHALDRSRMLVGAAATTQTFSVPTIQAFGFQALTPADHDGATVPPAGAPAYFARHRDDENSPPATNGSDKIELWSVRIDWATPANSTLTQLPNVLVSEFDSALCGLFTFSCIPQPGGTPLDPLREVIMNRLQYRNMGTHEVLVGNLATDVGDFADHAGVRWFELRKTGAGPWTLFQEGTYSPNATHHWMGATSMDQSGNIALAYSISNNTNQRPAIAYTGRLASDPSGIMTQPEFITVNGGGVQNSFRWGDYATLSVDPVDECSFWHTMEYMPGNGQWSTWISAFKFDNCPPAAQCLANAAATPAGASAQCQGQSTLLDAAASGVNNCSGTITYQWILDGLPLPGETASTYATDPGLATGAHTIDVEVGCSTDSICVDTLDTPITLTVESVTAAAMLVNPDICVGDSVDADASSSAAVGCAGTLTYQWLIDGTPVAGATNVTYATDPGLAAGVHTIDVEVTCPTAARCADSLDAPLMFNIQEVTAVAVATSTTLCAGSTTLVDASTSVLVSCVGAPQYQWLVDGAPVAGATGAQYTTDPALAVGAHTIDVVVTCPSGALCSDSLDRPIVVTVEPLPTLDCGTALYSGDTSTCIPIGLDSASDGTAHLWTPLAGGIVTNETSLNGACFTALAAGMYDVELEATLGSCTDTCAITVDVTDASVCVATSSATLNGPQTLCEGGSVDLDGIASMLANCAGSIEYQWLENGTPVGPFSPSSVYSLPTTLPQGAYSYDLVVRCSSDTACTDNLGAPIDVTVTAPPSVVDVLLAVKQPTQDDVQFSWTSSAVGFYRVNSVDVKTDLPAYGLTGAVERCFTADAVTLDCTHTLASPVGPANVLHYNVVGVCADDPTIEGP